MPNQQRLSHFHRVTRPQTNRSSMKSPMTSTVLEEHRLKISPARRLARAVICLSGNHAFFAGKSSDLRLLILGSRARFLLKNLVELMERM